MTSADYCEIGDLPTAFCAHCRGHRLPEDLESDDYAPRAERTSAWFQAEWQGKCACGDSFGPGTVVRYDVGGLRMQDCGADS